MSSRPLIVVGAGLAGLTLARALRLKGIPAVIYDRSKDAPRHPYSISLKSWTWKALVKLVEVDHHAFVQKVGVQLPTTRSFDNASDTNLRVNRAKLESLLRRDLTIHNDHKITAAKTTKDGVLLTFENSAEIKSPQVIAADGPNSQMRTSLIPEAKPQVLPFVAINGKRRLSEEVSEEISSYFEDHDHLDEHHGDVLLQAYVNSVENGKVSVSYTFSRPARPNDDPLYRPNRSPSEASVIPEEFYEEVSNLQGLSRPFQIIFSMEELRGARHLNWLMRSGLIPLDEVKSLAETNVVFIGEALHPLPILGSVGANVVIQEALQLADHIADNLPLVQYVEPRYKDWQQEVKQGEERLKLMHEPKMASSL